MKNILYNEFNEYKKINQNENFDLIEYPPAVVEQLERKIKILISLISKRT
jgi:hypothetical protein